MRKVAVVTVLAVAFLVSACSGIPGLYTVERSDEAAAAASAAGVFDAVSYADTVWGTDVPPAAAAAVPITDLFAGLGKDAAGTQSAYGHNQGSGSPWSFLVSGEATIADVDTTGASTLLVLEQDYAPNAQVAIQVGPAFIGTAIRDALGTIKFSEFVNQIDFADVATALNDRVRSEVVAGLDPTTLVGKQVKFTGAFALADPSSIVITPLKLEVSG
jgi:predicted lipoprotein